MVDENDYWWEIHHLLQTYLYHDERTPPIQKPFKLFGWVSDIGKHHSSYSSKVGNVESHGPLTGRDIRFTILIASQDIHTSFPAAPDRFLLPINVLTHLKNMSQIGNLPQVGVKIKNIWNHHLAMYEKSGIWLPPVFWHPAASVLRCANSYRPRSNSMPHRNWPLWEVPEYVVFSWQKWKVFLNMPWTIDLL